MNRQYRAAVVGIALVAVAFLTYRHYHHQLGNSLPGGAGGRIAVLVAKKAIPKGTPLSVIAAKQLYLAKTVRTGEKVFPDAIPDPSSLRGRVTVKRISAGQQLTAADFGPSSN